MLLLLLSYITLINTACNCVCNLRRGGKNKYKVLLIFLQFRFKHLVTN